MLSEGSLLASNHHHRGDLGNYVTNVTPVRMAPLAISSTDAQVVDRAVCDIADGKRRLSPRWVRDEQERQERQPCAPLPRIGRRVLH
jgi:hypothetical protein